MILLLASQSSSNVLSLLSSHHDRISLERDVLEQILHGFIAFLVRAIGNLQVVLAGPILSCGVAFLNERYLPCFLLNT